MPKELRISESITEGSVYQERKEFHLAKSEEKNKGNDTCGARVQI